VISCVTSRVTRCVRVFGYSMKQDKAAFLEKSQRSSKLSVRINQMRLAGFGFLREALLPHFNSKHTQRYSACDTGNRTNIRHIQFRTCKISVYKICTALLFVYCDQIIDVIFASSLIVFIIISALLSSSLYEIQITGFVILF